MPYLPIEDYGIIGDLHTCALVGKNGSIDWFCYPYFDSPSIFAALLDDEKGGRFQIKTTLENATRRQMYLPDTNVLMTRFLAKEGVGEIVDFMPIEQRAGAKHDLIRQVRVVRGEMPFELVCQPAFNYARDSHETVAIDGGVAFEHQSCSLALLSSAPLRIENGAAHASFTLKEGEQITFYVLPMEDGDIPHLSEEQADVSFHRTVEYWRRWISHSKYEGRWREMVNRSALVLKLLTFEPTGAIVAAPTTSLPETIGGERNWDYRYTWIRDASFTLYGLLRIGFTEEAHKFMGWLSDRLHELEPDGALQILYGIDGRHQLEEVTLDHLEGYRKSGPVRIGNGAYDQLQLDIYGEMMDAVYLFNKYGTPIGYDLWRHLRKLTDWVVKHWDTPDEGIWEVRGGRRHFVYSKLMCWVALDRATRLADKRSLPADRETWTNVRDRIYEQVMDKGWDPQRGSFVQAYNTSALDASNLVMPLVFFLSPTDPRMLSTIDAIREDLVSDSLVHRYDPEMAPDGLNGSEGTFSMCTFWLVEALTRAGRIDEARLMFEKMLGYANHLGLYSEEIGLAGEALGNFPQAFTHLALISAAFNLDRRLENH